MTIAIGLLASDGLVVAADTQEIVGTMKSDESKLLIANRGLEKQKAGALAITGAGDAGYLDSINMEVCTKFVSRKSWSFEKVVKKQVKDFYQDHVVPFGKFPDHDRPQLALIAGADVGRYRALWVSEKSTFSGPKKYCAVGLGRAQATVMLRRYYASMDTVRAASLAAYIIFHVKHSVDGCGNETQIVIVKDGYAAHVSPSNIQLMEHYFEELAAYENQLLHFGIGMELPEEKVDHTLARFSSLLLKNRENIMQCQEFKMSSYRRGARPVDQPEVRG